MSGVTVPFTPTSNTASNPRRVAYFYDPDVGNYSYYLGHPMKPHRIRMAHNLIVNYDLCDDIDESIPYDGTRTINDPIVEAYGGDVDGERARSEKLTGARGKSMQIYRAKRATKGEMTRFHSDEYIDLLEKVTPETVEAMTGGGVRCLTGEDCPAFDGLFEFCSISAGGSIAAAEKLNSGVADAAINWAGGLHHAKKTEASGFCYVNDIVLGILELLRIHPRVLYIDVDVHHGDGVEEAFYTTDRVMTASFHRFGEFFPGTGDVRDVGMKRGKGYAVNVPLRDGIRDDSYHSIFKPIISHIMEFFRPGAVVLQLGADSLSGDKLGGFNLTLQGHAECARFVKSFGVPVMLVGGGGYTTKNVARAWTMETAVMCGRELSENLPYNQYMEYYGPRYKLEVLPNNTDDHNSPSYLEAIKRTVLENLRNLPHAPGAQMSAVPSRRLGKELGLEDGDLSDPEDEVDARIRKLMKRKALHGTYSSSEDEDSEDEANGRAIRQGPHSRSRKIPLGQGSVTSSIADGDDPCGVRRKRTFFQANADEAKLRRNMGLSVPLSANGLTGQITPDTLVNGTNGIGLNGYLEGRMTEMGSRAGSPTSVV